VKQLVGESDGFDRYAQEVRQIEETVFAIDPSLRFQEKEEALAAIPGYIGRGTVFLAFRTGESVLKVGAASFMDEGELQPEYQMEEAKAAVGALERGKGIAGIEQLESYRLNQTPTIVTRYLPGKALHMLTGERLPTHPQPYFGLIDAWRAMAARRITPDCGGGNILYSAEHDQFYLLDYNRFEDAYNATNLEDAAYAFAAEVAPTLAAEDESPQLKAFATAYEQHFGPETAADLTAQFGAWNKVGNVLNNWPY
jgi:hypothetical protein